MYFHIVGEILDIETIASGKSVRESRRLPKFYAGRNWKKQEGAKRYGGNKIGKWYHLLCRAPLVRSHGIGAREFKIKRLLEVR